MDTLVYDEQDNNNNDDDVEDHGADDLGNESAHSVNDDGSAVDQVFIILMLMF